jgi:hypothetical protein
MEESLAQRIAIVVIHGIGEQVPMATLSGFIEAVWTTDLTLIPPGKPHPETGQGERTYNAAWYKPDPRTRNFDLRLVTTESYKTAKGKRRRADFFEFYWAHRVTGTRFDTVKAWLFGLMLRNPVTRVPPPLRPAWAVMWLLLTGFLAAGWAAKHWLGGEWMALVTLAYAAASAWVIGKLNDVVGDVVRYVDPSPGNIKTRQDIREDGVRLLETLMGVDEQGVYRTSEYDRVLVVGHSLGTIVGYDIVNHAFGRLNQTFDRDRLAMTDQTATAALEDLVREAWEAGNPLDLARYRTLQDDARRELNRAGNPWIVSDFISIGSPLTHAEFLLARDRQHLEELKARRVYPTCPPQLEYHAAAPHYHFSYEAKRAFPGPGASLKGKRVPHHAAAFAFTRWTNIYSPLRGIIGGDIVSGKVCEPFGLAIRPRREDEAPAALTSICGIKEVPVLPSADGTAEDRRERFLTHLKYWDLTVAAGTPGRAAPRHIQVLREALDLKEGAPADLGTQGTGSGA